MYTPPVQPELPMTEPTQEDILDAVKAMLTKDTETLSDEEALGVAALYPTWTSKIGQDLTVGERL